MITKTNTADRPGHAGRIRRPNSLAASVPAMRAIFFLDDWMLDRRQDVDLVFPAPQPCALHGANALGLATIIYDPDCKRFRAWSKSTSDTVAQLYESDDGVSWRPTKHKRQLYLRQQFYEQTWFYDHWTKNPKHRHKMITWPYEKDTYGGPGLIETSPDGITWTLQRNWAWSPPDGNGSDTSNNLFYNPFLKEYAVVCRKYHIDRRISMVTSCDLKHWSRPVLLLQPDHADPPLTQFYGMGVFLYRDEIFLGFPQFYRVPNDECSIENNVFCKMSGRVHSELAYSYDAHAWNRTTRRPVIPRGEPGEYGGGSIYTRALIQRPADGRLLIYSRGTLTLHDGGRRDEKRQLLPLPAKYRSGKNGLLLHTWRADGFACLESFSNTAMIRTRCLVPHSPELTLNLQIPFGEARVQVVNEKNVPVPGFTFADCLPLTGDDIRMPVRWREHQDLKAVQNGQRLCLEIRFSSGRLYAINLHCSPWYTSTKQPIPRP